MQKLVSFSPGYIRHFFLPIQNPSVKQALKDPIWLAMREEISAARESTSTLIVTDKLQHYSQIT